MSLESPAIVGNPTVVRMSPETQQLSGCLRKPFREPFRLMVYVLPFGQISFWGATSTIFPCLVILGPFLFE